MSKYQEYLNESEKLYESSLSRVWKHTESHDYGTISAFRYAPDCGNGTPYKKKENLQRNASLLSKLRKEGYSVTAIKGSYIENYKKKNARVVDENSFIVVDIQDKGNLKSTLLKSGEEFEQDSIVFGKAGSASYIIGTNHCPDPFYAFHTETKLGKGLFGEKGEFFSKVNGRPFVFKEDFDIINYGVCKYPTELRGSVETSKLHWSEIIL